MARKAKPKIDKKMVIDAFAEMAKEKKIDKDLLQGIVEETFSMIVKRKYGANSDFEIVVNLQKGDIEIYLIKQVVEEVEDPETEITLEEANLYSKDKLSIGDDFIEEITLDNIADNFGRRLVSFASQIMNQRIREVERDLLFNEYDAKIGELIVGEIYQKRSYMMLVMHNGAELKLMKDDQLPTDIMFLKKNKPVKAVIKEINRSQNGGIPEIYLSRKSDEFVKKLFELEIPEVSDGVVQIKAIAREPGERTKIALTSIVDRVDPVGACVGLKGIRINSIIRELGNENIDLLPWVEDTQKLMERAFSPAKVSEVTLYPETRTATVVVSPDQIALAVGRFGINIRLASKLTGYDIKVIKEGGEDIEISEFENEIGADTLKRLQALNILTAKEFLETEPGILIFKARMNYNTILEVRRVMLLEFDEVEDIEYVNQLQNYSAVELDDEENDLLVDNVEEELEAEVQPIEDIEETKEEN
jgi:N utilization substance protein A